MTDDKIKRINELSKKSKKEGLTEAEKREQHMLRQEYINNVKSSLRAKLENVVIIDQSGKRKPISKKTIH